MLEGRLELEGLVGAVLYAQLTIETTAVVVHVAHQHFFLFSFFGGQQLGFDVNGVVGTIHFANPAGYAAVFILFVVYQGQFSAKPLEHLEAFPVFRITFGGFPGKKFP